MRNFLENQQIDAIANILRPIKALLFPRDGWIKTMRETLGMTSIQLAHRLEVSPSRITRMENDELRKAVTMETLQKTAEALECDFVYAFVPRQSITNILKDQAEEMARVRIRRLQHTMTLEDQALSPEQLTVTLEHYIDQLMHGPLKYLWEEHDNEVNRKPRDHSA